MKMMERRVAVSNDYITPHQSPQKTCHGKPCFDWLTVQGHWVRVRALLLIKPAINISITICTYFWDGQAGVEKTIFPSPEQKFFLNVLKTSKKLSETTQTLSDGIRK